MGMIGPGGLAGAALGAFTGEEDCVADGVAPAGACPQAGIAGNAIAKTAVPRDGVAKNKIGRSRFIQVERVGTCKQNCSVSRGIPARSCEYPQFLDARTGSQAEPRKHFCRIHLFAPATNLLAPSTPPEPRHHSR